MKKVELLAPAGDYKAFLGAVSAGADAVYLGGSRFGARAYAQNFTEEEVCQAIRYAHLFGRKVYLTVNTLVKESEFAGLYDYLVPFYEEGLDGVIVQDLGVAAYIRRQFPDMELHISTQTTITGPFGAALMKQLGAVRVVPARELSLAEIRHIKEATGLEIETFIHGAVCYCYSGQCLFSSTLGGRSGNRGRCAQPCRLPYNGNQYPLSLKDMCTIEHIPELIRAGIDSFKIEGRMKKAEYAAGVTAIYRKYIDRYYADPDGAYRVEEADLERLRNLYVRSDLQDGYYYRHNGKEMVTLEQPGYAGCPEELLQEIQGKYLEKRLTLPVKIYAAFVPGEKASLSAAVSDREEACEISVFGMEVQQAQKSPLTRENIEKQLGKTGETPFSCVHLEIQTKGDVFLPVKALNELRRDALEQLEEKLLSRFRRTVLERAEVQESISASAENRSGLCAEVHDLEQAYAVLKEPGLNRLYLPSDCFDASGNGAGVYGLFAQAEVYRRENPGFTLYLALPHIFRERSADKMEEVWRNLQIPQIDGVLVRNLEELGWLGEKGYAKAVQADANLYVWNRETEHFFREQKVQMTLPLELSRKELQELSPAGKELIVYGRTPLMVTAGCVRKTLEQCALTQKKGKNGDFMTLTDRYRKNFPVWTNCTHCYNILYNSVPTSLHAFSDQLRKWKKTGFRMIFTTEKPEEARRITAFYREILAGRSEKDKTFLGDYTSGYFKRGVE